jgi:predicted phosphodiesterase
MRVACLYDIHGHLPALEAVLADPALATADRIVVGGDAVAGPMPVEVLDLLEGLADRASFLLGNADRDPGEWAAAKLGEQRMAGVTSWPATVSLDVGGLGQVLFCHGSPRSDEEIVTALSPPERMRPMLAGVHEPVVVLGHTHVQFDRMVEGTRVVNAGSVGMPYEASPGNAFWCLLGPDVELRRTGFDAAAAADRIARTGMPDAAAWADEYVRQQHTGREASEYFEELAARAR